MNWLTCPACGLKHSPRPDGLCPRCRTPSGAPTSRAEASFDRPPPFERAPSPSAPPSGEPAPARASDGGEPLPTTPVGAPGAWGSPPAASGAQGTGGGVEISVGALVSRSFNVWWKNVVRFTLLTLFAWVPLAVAGVAAAIVAGVSGSEGGAEASERLLLSVAPFLVIGGIATFVLFLAQFAGVTWGTLQLLAGRPAGFGAMLGAGFKRFGAVLAVGFVGTAAVLAGMLLLIVPGVLLGIGMAVVYPVVVSEQVGPIDAIKRSMALTKGHRGTVFGALMVVGLAAGGVNMGSNLLTTVLGSMAAPLAIVGVLLTLLIQLAMTSLSNVVCAVAYHDLRVAKEGVDTSQLAKVFE